MLITPLGVSANKRGEASHDSEKRCYTVKELQEILGVSRPSVYVLLKKNEFRSYVIGGKHIISKRSFEKW